MVIRSSPASGSMGLAEGAGFISSITIPPSTIAVTFASPAAWSSPPGAEGVGALWSRPSFLLNILPNWTIARSASVLDDALAQISSTVRFSAIFCAAV